MGPTVFDADAPKKCEVAITDSVYFHRPLHTALAKLAFLPGIYFFNFHNLLCDGNRCGAFIPGTDVLGFYDAHHLTEAGSYYLWPFLCFFLNAKGLLLNGEQHLKRA